MQSFAQIFWLFLKLQAYFQSLFAETNKSFLIFRHSNQSGFFLVSHSIFDQ